MSDNSAGQSPEQLNSAIEAETGSIRSAAQWLVGAGAAIATVLLTGVQLSSLGRLVSDGSAAQVAVALTASAVGLLAVGLLLLFAARVLVHPGWTLSRMSQMQTTDPEKWAKHWVRRELSARRALIVPTDDLDPAALYRHLRSLLVAWSVLHEQGTCTVSDSPLHGTTPPATYQLHQANDVEQIRARLNLAHTMANRVEGTANLLAVRRRYRRLVRSLPPLGLLLIAAVVTFAAATDAAPTVNAPLRVLVSFPLPDPTRPQRTDIPPSCAGATVEATAVGGTLDEPVVVALSPACRLDRVHITADVGLAAPLAPPR